MNKKVIKLILLFGLLNVYAYGDTLPPKIINGGGVTLSTNEYTEFGQLLKRYPLEQMLDNNKKTTWVFESKKKVAPEILIHFGKTQYVDKFGIINGYAKSDELYKANNIIRKILVKDLDSGQSKSFKLANTLDMQYFALDFKARQLLIRVEEVISGTRYNDYCISELEFYSDSNPLLKSDSYVSISGGEYPLYKIIFKNKIVETLERDSIEEAFFIEDGKFLVLVNSPELGATGISIYNLETGSNKNALEDMGVIKGSLSWKDGAFIGKGYIPGKEEIFDFQEKIDLP